MDNIYIILLKIFRSKKKFPLINEDDLKIIRFINSQLEDSALYDCILESDKIFMMSVLCRDKIQIYKIITDSYYLILGAHFNCYHIVEFNSTDRCMEIFEVLDYVLKNFRYKPFICDCRDVTTYQIISLLEKYGRIRILNDYTRELDGEIMHNIKFKVIRQKKDFEIMENDKN